MMGTKMLKQLRDAISNLNPHEVREKAEQPLIIELFATSEEGYSEMFHYLVPSKVSAQKREELKRMLFRSGNAPRQATIQIFAENVVRPEGGFTFYSSDPERTINEILEKRPELSLALARHFCPFRQPVVNHIVKEVSKENALFTLATAVPYIVPFISLP